LIDRRNTEDGRCWGNRGFSNNIAVLHHTIGRK